MVAIISLGTLSLIIHIVAGVLTLIAGPIAIFANRKYLKLHKIAGNVFFYAMLVVCVSAVIGFLKRPDQVFFQFLLGIAILVFAGILRVSSPTLNWSRTMGTSPNSLKTSQ